MPCFDSNTTIQTKEFAQQLVDVAGCKLVGLQLDLGVYVVSFVVLCFLIFVAIIVAAILNKKRK